ncbi:MAG: PEP-CTERM sorting domain-containing protein [Deltaproteobacteria bacterium]|nr:PEP-CTERM sorting domain-containing protein [Deltaproteobacteria bacterium]MCW9048918.1 PEP-CTERM sorting domain-containing protein [Deltaproteobacteria bacterium]
MKIKIASIITIFIFVGMCGFASAYTIGFDYALDGNNYTSNYAGAIVETFESSPIWVWSGDYAIVTGSVGGRYAAPFGESSADATSYVTVPSDLSSGYADVSLGATYNYFGLWWGSVDDYNTLSFYKDGGEVASFGGYSVAPPADGDQGSDVTNLYVNFYDLPDFDSFRMTSTSYAFEADNIAVGTAPVPEPSTLLLLGSGLLGLGWYGWKRKK